MAHRTHEDNGDYKDDGPDWLSLSALEALKKENDSPKSANSKLKVHCESQEASIEAFKETFISCSHRTDCVGNQTQGLFN